MQDNYNKIKGKYPKSILLIKAGSFYISMNNDAIIMNILFGYKLKQISSYIRIGFPLNNLNKVTSWLTEKEINYVILDNNVDHVKFKHNYNKYIDKIFGYELIISKINFVTNKLNKNMFNPKIIDILNEMEKILCKINY